MRCKPGGAASKERVYHNAAFRTARKYARFRELRGIGGKMPAGLIKMTENEGFMKEAIRQAKKAEKLNEVPIGCVIVYDGKIIARGYNRRNTDKSTLAHAEIIAIKRASKVIKDWRLEDCTLYVTLEPCQMCAGAIVQARIPKVVIGTMNSKAGCAGSVINVLQMKEFNHQVDICKGVLADECKEMMQNFFRNLREKKKMENY